MRYRIWPPCYNGLHVAQAQDASFEAIPGTSRTLLSLGNLDASAQAAMREFADEDDANINSDDDDDDDDDDDELLNQLRSTEGHQGTDQTNFDEDDTTDAMDAIHEFVEEHEANHADSINISNEELTRDAVSKTFDGFEDEDVQQDDGWVDEQKSETLETERNKMESEMATRLISSGAKIVGKHFLQIADDSIAETWVALNVQMHYAISISTLIVVMVNIW